MIFGKVSLEIENGKPCVHWVHSQPLEGKAYERTMEEALNE